MTRPFANVEGSIADRLADVDRVTEAINSAGRRAVRDRVRAGLKIAVWKDGQVVWMVPSSDDPTGASAEKSHAVE